MGGGLDYRWGFWDLGGEEGEGSTKGGSGWSSEVFCEVRIANLFWVLGLLELAGGAGVFLACRLRLGTFVKPSLSLLGSFPGAVACRFKGISLRRWPCSWIFYNKKGCAHSLLFGSIQNRHEIDLPSWRVLWTDAWEHISWHTRCIFEFWFPQQLLWIPLGCHRCLLRSPRSNIPKEERTCISKLEPNSSLLCLGQTSLSILEGTGLRSWKIMVLPRKIRDLSSEQLNVAVKKPLGPSYSVTCPLGFNLEAIHPCKAFSIGQNPRNLPMSAWSFMNWIWLFILWLGRSTFICSTVFGMQVAEDAFGCDVVAFWSVPFPLIAVDPAVEFPAASIFGPGPWSVHGGTPVLFRESV